MTAAAADVGPGAVDVALARYLDAVVAELRAALAASGAVRDRTLAGLVPSRLEAASRLEDRLDALIGAGGKLLRPALVYLGYVAALEEVRPDEDGCPSEPTGWVAPEHTLPLRPAHPVPASACAPHCRRALDQAAESEPLVRLGAAMELLHLFGLVQDDVMDESATRRGRPSAHAIAAQAFREHAHAVDGAARFGESVAVLSGDLAFALAQRELRRLPDTVADRWDTVALELVQGQRLDLVFAAEGRVDPASTRRVAAAKSGDYTVRHPLELGACLARPDVDPPAWLATFGDHLGQAFALADDMLGVWGDPARTGKPVGDDIAQRKPSTVLGIAEELLGGAVSARFRTWSAGPDERDVDGLLRACADAGVREAAQAELDAHVAAAQASLAALPCPDLRDHFLALTRTLATREN